jgi:hypothetical protein
MLGEVSAQLRASIALFVEERIEVGHVAGGRMRRLLKQAGYASKSNPL